MAQPSGTFVPVVHVVDDDEAVRDSLAILLRTRGFQVREHDAPDAFLAAAARLDPGCIVTDVQMPAMSGLEMLVRLRARGVDWPAVVITGRATPGMVREAAALAAEFVEKPFLPEALVAAVARLLDRES